MQKIENQVVVVVQIPDFSDRIAIPVDVEVNVFDIDHDEVLIEWVCGEGGWRQRRGNTDGFENQRIFQERIVEERHGDLFDSCFTVRPGDPLRCCVVIAIGCCSPAESGIKVDVHVRFTLTIPKPYEAQRRQIGLGESRRDGDMRNACGYLGYLFIENVDDRARELDGIRVRRRIG